MLIISPSVEVLTPIDSKAVLEHLERCGRVCYKSENLIKEGSAEKFLRGIISRGHEAVLEHYDITAKFTCDRGVSHELVRHRLASYCVTGDTVLRNMSRKSWTVEELFGWQTDPKRKGLLRLINLRSVDETTRMVVPNKVLGIYCVGEKTVFRLTTESGRSIKCTADHKIATSTGYKELQELKIGDSIWVNGRKLGVFQDKIVSIEQLGVEKVYDVAMAAPYHNFVADGIVVHNCQESSRYCSYIKDKFGNQITVIKPCFLEPDTEQYTLWENACKFAEAAYFAMLRAGNKPEEARAVLPNSLKTELVMTANIREWRHFFKLRCDEAAHPQAREVASMLLEEFKKLLPVLFDDL